MKSVRDTVAPGRKTILLVEDERDMLRVLEKFLSARGYKILAAYDGEKAIEVFCRHKTEIDAVFLDVGLPKTHGFDVLTKIKNENPGVRVVVTSGYLDQPIQRKMYDAGIRDFVAKPYQLPDVAKTIERLLTR